MTRITDKDGSSIAVINCEPNEREKPDVAAEPGVGDHGAHPQAEEAGLIRDRIS